MAYDVACLCWKCR